MADLVILVLFLISGAITGWIGVNWLPKETLDQITNLKKFKNSFIRINSSCRSFNSLPFSAI